MKTGAVRFPCVFRAASLHPTAFLHMLDILPSGLLTPTAHNLIGSGCVIHVPALLKELGDLEAKGLANARERLFISDRAQYVCRGLGRWEERIPWVLKLIAVALSSISIKN